MTREVRCSGCGAPFDPDRPQRVPGADTSRCPACGTPHDVEPQREESGLTGAAGSSTFNITVEEGGNLFLNE